MFDIGYHSAPCGSGKTRSIVRRAISMAEQGHRVAIAQPTRDLIDRTVNEELKSHTRPPFYDVFHGRTVGDGNVVKSLVQYLRKPPDGGQIIFLTHAVLPLVPFWSEADEWHLIIDEEMYPLRYKKHVVPLTHDLLTSFFEVDPVNAVYGRVVVSDERSLRDFAENEAGDDVHDLFSETAWVLLNSHYATFVNLEHYHRLVDQRGGPIAFHSLLLPSVVEEFGSVFMAAANFDETAILKLWTNHGANFVEDRAFGADLRFATHPNGGLVDIFYATDKAWSRRNAQSKTGKGDETSLDCMIEATRNLFDGHRFVWQANKYVSQSPFDSTAARLPNKPHGLNSFLEVDDIAFLSALNPPSDHFRFLETQGMTGQEVRGAIYFQNAYQSIMRTSLRDPSSTRPKRILVPDAGLAAYLHDLFPGSRLQRIDVGIKDGGPVVSGRPRKHQSDKERVAAYRQKTKDLQSEILNGMFTLRSQDADGKDRCGEENTAESCNENHIDIFTPFVTPLSAGTIYRSIRSPHPMGYLNLDSDDDLFQVLHRIHDQRIDDKESNVLISPAVFDPNLVSGSTRAMGNILYLRHLWLDFEDGDLRPETVPDLFPHLKMVVTNSYRNTEKEPRFRVIIPTTQKMTVDAHNIVFDAIAHKIEDAGYRIDRSKKETKRSTSFQRRSGLDWSKRAATSLFYAPAKAADLRGSFILEFSSPGRTAIDVEGWIRSSDHLIQPDVGVGSDRTTLPFSDSIDQSAVEAAISEWRQSPSYRGEGNSRFFRLAVQLRSAGMSPHEIEATLQVEAGFGRNPMERRAQIPSIMSTLRRGMG